MVQNLRLGSIKFSSKTKPAKDKDARIHHRFDDGVIYRGCNVENLSFGLTICAERNAVCAAIAAGCRRFHALVVVADTREPISPCGACRQVMAEFGDFPVLMATKETSEETSIGVLLRTRTGILDSA